MIKRKSGVELKCDEWYDVRWMIKHTIDEAYILFHFIQFSNRPSKQWISKFEKIERREEERREKKKEEKRGKKRKEERRENRKEEKRGQKRKEERRGKKRRQRIAEKLDEIRSENTENQSRW